MQQNTAQGFSTEGETHTQATLGLPRAELWCLYRDGDSCREGSRHPGSLRPTTRLHPLPGRPQPQRARRPSPPASPVHTFCDLVLPQPDVMSWLCCRLCPAHRTFQISSDSPQHLGLRGTFVLGQAAQPRTCAGSSPSSRTCSRGLFLPAWWPALLYIVDKVGCAFGFLFVWRWQSCGRPTHSLPGAAPC